MKVKETNIWNNLISATIKEMIQFAKENNLTAKQKLNDVTVFVNGDSCFDLIYRDQKRAQSGYIKKEVGPYPKTELSAKDKERDARIKAKNELERERQQAKHAKNARIHREKVEKKLSNAPEIELSNKAGWQKSQSNNRDDYGNAILAYAERWARLMQIEMANSRKLEEIASATSHEADLEGITGFMYLCAVSCLSENWKHGEKLRRWHSRKSQL